MRKWIFLIVLLLALFAGISWFTRIRQLKDNPISSPYESEKTHEWGRIFAAGIFASLVLLFSLL